ncbi:hypothetical protein RHGRI_033059 [Rhododendron griersonianum]|uniref:UDP-glycosyltransferases domain-containing protein n=1 Tax=Rhododendron griersonianum TaxID=479676 RepID=A0AAV6HVS2_9ERIC|nr:hypothetical protein RHGRI_033059 [Rhododendron griersonianum]
MLHPNARICILALWCIVDVSVDSKEDSKCECIRFEASLIYGQLNLHKFYDEQRGSRSLQHQNWGIISGFDKASSHMHYIRALVALKASPNLVKEEVAACSTRTGASYQRDWNMAVGDKPHVVCIPYPSQSHMKAMLKLAKLLHHKGCHITFVNTEYNHRRLLKARGPNSLDGLPDFRFETIPDGLPPSDANATQHIPSLCESIRKNALAPFLSLVSKINDGCASPPDVPPVTCIVSDGFMSFTITAGEQLGVPVILFFTMSACGVMGFYQLHVLLEKGLTPLKDVSYVTNGYLDTVIDWIPGMKDIRLKDLPSFIRTTDPNNTPFNFCMEAAVRASKASAIILHTFDVLEQDLLNAFTAIFPFVYSIGPLQLLLNHISKKDESESIGYNLWKEESECLKWLDSKAPGSVIYVNFAKRKLQLAAAWLEPGRHISSKLTGPLETVHQISGSCSSDFDGEVFGNGIDASYLTNEYLDTIIDWIPGMKDIHASYLTNGYLDTIIDWIPGIKDIRLKDLPSFIRTTDPNDVTFNFCKEAAERSSKVSAIILHTFDALEQKDESESIGYNLWKEESECLKWLDSKESGSVIYVNFGSVTSITKEQLEEFGWGLVNSHHNFLWIIRPDLVMGDKSESTILLAADIKERGLIVAWCSQEEVLNHRSVGGFLTHCGWNSTIESLSAGVPMICWPWFADQQMNCRYACTEWEVGLEIDSDVKREEVEKLVRELMGGEKGKKMKRKATEWKELAEKATGSDGSSTLSLNNLANKLFISKGGEDL